MTTDGPAPHDGTLTRALAARLERVWGTAVRITDLRRLPGGASRETWSFDAHTDEGRTGLVLRRDPPAVPRPDGMAREARALRAAADAQVPVPALIDHGDGRGDGDEAIAAPYLVLERLDGETIPRRLLRDERWAAARDGLAGELGRILARIHTIDPRRIGDLDGGDPLHRLVDVYLELDEPRPTVEIGLRWLRDHRPASRPDTVVHGDFRNGNLLLDRKGVRGVLDWELVHRGDPNEDLGWLCVKAWRFGAAAPVGGFGSRQDLLDGYAEVAGSRPDPGAVRWWEVYGTLRWLLLCRRQAERHLSGAEPSVEYAALGRRVCEQEHDLMLALGLTEPVTVADPLAARPWESGVDAARLHDLPDVDGLIDAVQGFLAGEARAVLDGRARFHAAVAANALAIARRELRAGAEQRETHRRRLARLGCGDDADLAAAIADGSLDHRWEEVVTVVRQAVIDKLTVANPGYLAQPA